MIAVATKPIPIYAKQALFRQSEQTFRGFCAGRGSGKTRIGAQDLCMRARGGEPWMVVSPSYAVVDETTWPTFKEVAEEMGVWLGGKKTAPSRARIRTRDGGIAEVVFRTGDKPEQLRGANKAGLWLDEASIMHPDVFKLGIAVLRWKGQMGKCLMTFTPKGRRHWTFETFFERLDDREQDALHEWGMGSDGCSLMDGYRDCQFIAGQFYRRKPNTFLVHAHTKENPFLPDNFYDLIAQNYSSGLAAQELGGEFVDLEGLMFRREWFRIVDHAPKDATLRVRYWDRAATEGAGSYTAGVLMSRDAAGTFFIEHVVRGQWGAMERDKVIKQTTQEDALRYKNSVMIYVEQEPGSGGKEAAQQMVLKLAGYPVYMDVVGGQRRFKVHEGERLPGEAKVVRAQPFAAQCEAGNVHIVNGRYCMDLLDELSQFPLARFSDQVDGCSGAFNKLAVHSHGLDPGEIVTPQVEVNPQRHGVQVLLDRSRRRFGK